MKPKSLDDFHGESRESGEQINYKNCPVCGSDRWKTYVNPKTGMWYCHAGSHQGGGKVEGAAHSHVHDEAAEIMALLDVRGGPPVGWPEIQLPEWQPLSKTGRRYLIRRGFKDYIIRDAALVEMASEGRILVPYYDNKGRLIYWNSRAFTKTCEGPKYKAAPGRHPLYVPYRDSARAVVLVEGVFDALAVVQKTGYPAIALGGKSLPSYLHADLRDEIMACSMAGTESEVVIALDGDALSDAITLHQKLPGSRIALLPHGDDPASLPSQELINVLSL